jgi:hypothetical protein
LILSLFKTPKAKKSRRKYLIGQLDRIMSLKVRKRDRNCCKKCGCTPCYHHHIFGKAAHPSTRWEISNGVAVCYHCHVSAHASPEDFRRWVLSWMGEREYEALYVKAQMRMKYREVDLEWILKQMKGAA